MVKRTIAFFGGVVLSFVGYSGATNDIVRAIAEVILMSEGCADDIREVSFGEGAEILTFDDVMNTFTNESWTTLDNVRAIEGFFANILSRDGNTVTVEESETAGTLMSFLSASGRSGILGYARSLASVTNLPCRDVMWRSYLTLVVPSLDENAFVDRELVNIDDEVLRASIFKGYVGKLQYGGLNNVVVTNGAALLYHHVTNRVGSLAVDPLLTKCFPAFPNSSNRLSLARMALADDRQRRIKYLSASNCLCNISADFECGPKDDSLVARYFAPITNRLMSIQGPLPEVEELRR